MNDPFTKVETPENGIVLKEDKSITLTEDCKLEKVIGWVAIANPQTDEPVTAQADGFFKAPVKITGGHKGGTITVEYRT